MLDIFLILLFGAGINWIVSLHQVYQASDSLREKRIAVVLSMLIGVGLGYLAIL